MGKVKFAIPAGSLAKSTFEILQRSGYKISGQDRTYRPTINDPQIELKILRPQEIPVFVAEGLQDVGITGEDWIMETGADVEVLQNLEYGKIRLVIAIPKSSSANSISKLMEDVWSKGKNFRVSTEYLNIAADYIRSNKAYQKHFGKSEPLIVTPWWRKGENPRAKIFLSFGATEAKPPENSDCIMESKPAKTAQRTSCSEEPYDSTIGRSRLVLCQHDNQKRLPHKPLAENPQARPRYRGLRASASTGFR